MSAKSLKFGGEKSRSFRNSTDICVHTRWCGSVGIRVLDSFARRHGSRRRHRRGGGLRKLVLAHARLLRQIQLELLDLVHALFGQDDSVNNEFDRWLRSERFCEIESKPFSTMERHRYPSEKVDCCTHRAPSASEEKVAVLISVQISVAERADLLIKMCDG